MTTGHNFEIEAQLFFLGKRSSTLAVSDAHKLFTTSFYLIKFSASHAFTWASHGPIQEAEGLACLKWCWRGYRLFASNQLHVQSLFGFVLAWLEKMGVREP